MGKRGNLAGYVTEISNKQEEEEEEEYAAVIHKQPARNPVGGNQVWDKENDPTLTPSTLGIHGGRAGLFTKQVTTLPEEGNKQNEGKKQEHYIEC